MRTSYSGLPICLSGIRILPQERPPHQQARSLPGRNARARSPRHAAQSHMDAPNLASDCITPSSFGSPLNYITSTDESDDETVAEVRECQHSSSSERMNSRSPRFAIAKEMADLDRRREAIKKQRYLQNAGQPTQYGMIREQYEFILACLESQSKLQSQSEGIYKSICAKAA